MKKTLVIVITSVIIVAMIVIAFASGERNTAAYEVDFCADGYEYKADMHSGKNLKCEKDFCNGEYCKGSCYREECRTLSETEVCTEDCQHGENCGYKNECTGVNSAQAEEPVTVAANQNNINGSQNENICVNNEISYISIDEAKNCSVKYAGVDISSAVFKSCEFDYDDGCVVYEIEFSCNGTEYRCEVDAKSGRICDYEKEYCDTHGHSHRESNHNKKNHH